MSAGPRISLIVPAYNEQAYLPRLLESVDRARERYVRGADAVEIIVADNVSTDRTAEIARSHGCRVVAVETRVIAAVRNAGARAARGEILTFADADTQMHPETFNQIDRALDNPGVIVGATGIRFERRSVGIAFTFAMLVVVGSVIRLAIRERPTLNVDTGVTFCRRRDFEKIGGYREERLFAEDVQLLFDLRKLGRFARGMTARAIFSTRKFDQFGDWHMFALGPRLVWNMLGRGGIDQFARRYWYSQR